MKALLRKDLPWLLGFLVLGTIGLAMGLMEHSFVYCFVVSPGDREGLFHVAWSVGLGLGAVAMCFDEALGTREFLAQRPVAITRLGGARLLGCGLVLLGWFLLAPLGAWLCFVVGDLEYWSAPLRQLPQIWATLTTAVSACAIGALAGALPAPWWARLLIGGALQVTSLTLVYHLSHQSVTSLPVFVVSNLAIAALAVGLCMVALAHRADPDRAMLATVRRRVMPSLVVLLAAFFCMLQMEVQSEVATRLRRVYPRPVVLGGKVEIVQREDYDDPYRIVDAEHRAIAVIRRPETWLSYREPSLGKEFLRIEAPGSMWSTLLWMHTSVAGHSYLVLDGDGRAFWVSPGDGVRATGRYVTHEPFSVGSGALSVESGGESAHLVRDAATNELWRFEDDLGHFIPQPLSEGDRFVGFDHVHDEELVDRPGVPPIGVARNGRVVRGERFVYGVKGGVLVAVGPNRKVPSVAVKMGRVTNDSPLSWTVQFDADPVAGHAAFSHHFTPHTSTERKYAAMTMGVSLLRPPLLQALAAVCPEVPPASHWLLDPLVAQGRRWWLVLVSITVGLLSAWSVRRRLRTLGATPSTMLIWTMLCVGLGPFAAIASVVCERPRAYANRAITTPVPLPRIFTSCSLNQDIA